MAWIGCVCVCLSWFYFCSYSNIDSLTLSHLLHSVVFSKNFFFSHQMDFSSSFSFYIFYKTMSVLSMTWFGFVSLFKRMAHWEFRKMRSKDEMEIQSNEKWKSPRLFWSISTHQPIKTCVNIDFSSLVHFMALCVRGGNLDFRQRHGQTT